MSGHRVPPNGGFYSASKFAVRALTEGLRTELRAASADHIRITNISPGFVDTEFFDRYHDGDSAKVAEIRTRVPEMLNPEDIADTIEFALGRPAHMQLHDLLIRPTRQIN
jgi:NADP-dependent 3-hydroxy acid dehydrogenase YdfG